MTSKFYNHAYTIDNNEQRNDSRFDDFVYVRYRLFPNFMIGFLEF